MKYIFFIAFVSMSILHADAKLDLLNYLDDESTINKKIVLKPVVIKKKIKEDINNESNLSSNHFISKSEKQVINNKILSELKAMSLFKEAMYPKKEEFFAELISFKKLNGGMKGNSRYIIQADTIIQFNINIEAMTQYFLKKGYNQKLLETEIALFKKTNSDIKKGSQRRNKLRITFINSENGWIFEKSEPIQQIKTNAHNDTKSMIMKKEVTVNPKPFGLQIGEATLSEVKERFQTKDAGINKYSQGKMLYLNPKELDFSGIEKATVIFSENEKLLAVLLKMPKSKFNDIFVSLKSKYKLINKKVPFVGNKEAKFQSGNTEITLNAPHMGFDMNLNYINKDLWKAYKQKEQKEQILKKKKETSKL